MPLIARHRCALWSRIAAATALVAALAALNAAPSLAAPVGAARHAAARHALARVQWILHAREQGILQRHARARRDLSATLRELAADMPALAGADRRAARSLLARPSDGASDPQGTGYTSPEAPGSPYCTAHFCVHWVAAGSDAPNLASSDGSGVPDYVRQVAAVAENAYTVEVGQLGWRAPKGDGALGGGFNQTDIYLKNFQGTGVYGYTAPDPGQPQGNRVYAYLVIDNTFDASKFPRYSSPTRPLEVTLAHEFNHVLQYNYDALEDVWMFESTAVWMEGKVYPADYDYLQYLPRWEALTAVPLTAFDGLDPSNRNNVKVYGSALWQKWLEGRYGTTVVRDAWTDSPSLRPASYALGAFDAAIRQHGGHGFSDAFDRFAAATAEWQASNSGFPDGPLYGDVARGGRLTPNHGGTTVKLDHTTFSDLDVPAPHSSRVKLVVTLPRGTSGAAALVARTGTGATAAEHVHLAELAHGGSAAVTVTRPSSLTRLTAVLINSDMSQNGTLPTFPDWQYTRDRQAFAAHVTTDFRAPRVRSRSPRPNGRGGSRSTLAVTFTKALARVDRRAVALVGPSGRHVAFRIRLRSRRLEIVPRRPLARGHYRVELRSSITDVDLNHLATTRWSFQVG